jgi:hypothetical protein
MDNHIREIIDLTNDEQEQERSDEVIIVSELCMHPW